MRETRLSGSEGGGPAPNAGLPTPIRGPWFPQARPVGRAPCTIAARCSRRALADGARRLAGLMEHRAAMPRHSCRGARVLTSLVCSHAGVSGGALIPLLRPCWLSAPTRNPEEPDWKALQCGCTFKPSRSLQRSEERREEASKRGCLARDPVHAQPDTKAISRGKR